MSNCVDVPLNYENDAEVEVTEVNYQANAQGFQDVLNGKFVVHIRREHKETELVMTISKCAKGSTGICTENPTEFTESVDCKRFRTDTTGPWHMFAPAIDKRNICAEIKGEYNITGAQIKAEQLEKYMTIEEGHFRIRMLHHL